MSGTDLVSYYMSKYSGEEIDELLTKIKNSGSGSNQNLLDNWYFIGGGSQQGGGKFPINQKGQTEYTEIYTIDRWILSGGINKLVLSENGITLYNTATNMYFAQRIESLDTNAVYTFSVLSGGQLYSVTGVPGTGKSAVTPFGNLKLQLQWNDASIVEPTVTISSTATITAAKLELGSVQTLAHQDADGNWILNDPPPNYALELEKCQMYFIPPSDAWNISAFINGSGIVTEIPCKMRGNPTIVGDGFQVYWNGSWHSISFNQIRRAPTKCLVVFIPINGPALGESLLLNKTPGLSCEL